MNPADQPRSAHDPFTDPSAQQSYAPINPPLADQTRELSVPEANQRRWSGKKTAVVAAMAIGLASAGAAGASAAVPLGSSIGGGESRQMGPGGRGGAQFPGGGTFGPGGSMPDGQGAGPGQQSQQGQSQQGQSQQHGQSQGQPSGGQGTVPTKPASASDQATTQAT